MKSMKFSTSFLNRPNSEMAGRHCRRFFIEDIRPQFSSLNKLTSSLPLPVCDVSLVSIKVISLIVFKTE